VGRRKIGKENAEKLPAPLCVHGTGIDGKKDPVIDLALMDGRGKMPFGQDSLNLTDYITKICHESNAPSAAG
jgi:hypothetical protein